MYQITRLPNGLTVATAEMPHMASVSVGLWVGVGGRYEPRELNGVSHFIEHMLFKGTRRRSAKDISQAVEGVGGYLNAFTTEENTCFYSRARYDRLEELVEVLTDMFLNSVFDPIEIAKEREVIKEELAMYLDQPHHHVHELLNETLWPRHPLGRSLTGTRRTLNGIDRRQMLAFRRRHYVTGGVLIAAAGKLRHAQVLRAVRPFGRRVRSGARTPCLPYSGTQTCPQARVAVRDTAQMQIALGIRTYSRHDSRRHALRVLNAILGENMSSRLFQVLREDHGLAYSIQSSLGFFDDVGSLTISAGLETDKLREVLQLTMRELRRCREEPFTAAELQRSRDYLHGQLDLGLESTESQMNWIAEQLLAYGRILQPAQVKSRLSKVTAAQVQAVAREVLVPAGMNLAVVSTLKSSRGLADLLVP
jgi:predicted Zn-dependent peptidase